MISILLLAIGIVGGLCFAALATYLNIVRGDALRSVANANTPAECQALVLKFKNLFSISTGAPIVALYIVAALVAVGPLWLYYTATTNQAKLLSRPFEVQGSFSGYDFRHPLCIRLGSVSVESTGAFLVPLWRFSSFDPMPSFSTSGDYQPITVDSIIDQANENIVLTLMNTAGNSQLKAKVDWDQYLVTLQSPIPLIPILHTQARVSNTPTPTKKLPMDLRPASGPATPLH